MLTQLGGKNTGWVLKNAASFATDTALVVGQQQNMTMCRYICAMKIAVNMAGRSGNDYMAQLLFLLSQQPGNEWFFVSDQALHLHGSVQLENTVVLGKPIRSLVGLRWWHDVKLAAWAKRNQIDLLIHCNSEAALTTPIPQLLWIPQLHFRHAPKQFSRAALLFRKTYLPRYLKKAAGIIVPSSLVAQELINHYAATGVHQLPPFVEPIQSIPGWAAMQALKDNLTDGKEYFLFAGGDTADSNLIHVLKGYSQFKKWQQSQMKLVITGTTNAAIMEKISTYRFRDDVVLLNESFTAADITLIAGAYAVIYTPAYEGAGGLVLRALQAGTAVITTADSPMQQWCGPAALYVSATDAKEIAAEMIRLYQDEALRHQLISMGKTVPQQFNKTQAAEKLKELLSTFN